MYEEILFNYMLDLRKKDINRYERAKLIQKYLHDNKISQRQLAKEIGVPHSTIQDWLLVIRLEPEEYETMKDKGLSDTDVYRHLRNNKTKPKKEVLETCFLDKEIEKFLTRIKEYITSFDINNTTTHSKDKIDNLIEHLEEIKQKIDRTKNYVCRK
jgi:transposase